MTYTETRLREACAILSAVVLIVEDGDAELAAKAAAELPRIDAYVERLKIKAEERA